MELTEIPVKYRHDIEAAANLLKNEGCKSVFLFGSLVTGNSNENSDIDLGITGLPPKKFFRVYSMLDRSSKNKIDLVDFDENTKFYTLLKSLNEVVELG
jgi:predicted nucleotidyltransferase